MSTGVLVMVCIDDYLHSAGLGNRTMLCEQAGTQAIVYIMRVEKASLQQTSNSMGVYGTVV